MSSDWRVSNFEYPTVIGGAANDRATNKSGDWDLNEQTVIGRPPDERALRESQARELGRLEGEKKVRAEYNEQMQKTREGISNALREFEREKKRYFEQVEAEVVQLALAISKRVLRREAQIDPDLLKGLVRYTLEKLREGTHVKLRVHPARALEWRDQFGGEVIGDPDVAEGICQIETEVGTTAVSVDTQLKEIEHGLMDLLAQRPVSLS